MQCLKKYQYDNLDFGAHLINIINITCLKVALIMKGLPQQFAGLQAVQIVFSKQKNLFQCTDYWSISVIICFVLPAVVLHKKDAVQWNPQQQVELVDLSFKTLKHFC